MNKYFGCCKFFNENYHIFIFPYTPQIHNSKHGFSKLVHLQATQKLLSSPIQNTQDKKIELGTRDQQIIEQIIQQKFQTVVPKVMFQITKKEINNILLRPLQIGLMDRQLQSGNYCIKMVKKSNYESLLESHQNKKQKWIDPDFKQVPQSVIRDNTINLKWEPLNTVSKQSEKQVVFIDKFIQPTDIVQSSQLGDCYFLSAIAGLAKKPQRILRLFSSIQINDNGIYMVRLIFKGIFQQVVVDQFFPFNVESKQLFTCRPCKYQSQIYVMVLEKCWAKLWKSYSKIDGGLTRQSLRALSGGALTKTYFLQDEASNSKGNDFFNQLIMFNKKHFVMCVGTNKNEKVNITHKVHGQIKVQIQAGHIYLVQKVVLQYNVKKVKIYNPWGHNLIAGTTTEVNGEFKIKWNDFIKSFYELTVSKINDKANYLYIQLQGCRQNKFKFIELTANNDEPCYYGITISQTDIKQKHDFAYNKYICVNFIGLKYHEGNQYELISFKSSFQYSDHYFQFNQLTKGKYLIAIYFTEVEIKEQLTFSVYSQASFAFKEVNFDAQFQKHFLSRTLLNYNRKNSQHSITKYPDPNNKNIWISFHALVQNSIFGYYLLHVGNSSPSSFKVQMSKNQFQYINLKLLPPHDKEAVQITATPGHETIIVFIAYDIYNYRKSDADYYYSNKRHRHEDLVFGQTIYKS